MKRWCCVLILIFESSAALVGSGDSARPRKDIAIEDAEWPIFKMVDEILQARALANKREWVTLPLKAQQNDKKYAKKIKRFEYPVFEDDCQIPKLNEMYQQLLGYMENGTFVEVGGSGKLRALIFFYAAIKALCLMFRPFVYLFLNLR
jgi:hypothetical protein